MADFKITLSIQEIVADFESLARHDERLDVLFDLKDADDSAIDRFHEDMQAMISKYIPNYLEKVPEEYFSDDSPTYDRALMLYSILYGNFKEIFYQLI